MNVFVAIEPDETAGNTVLWSDGERNLCRGTHAQTDGSALAVLPAAEHPTRATLDRLIHEYELRDALDSTWAARPIALMREHGSVVLLLEDPGGEPLGRRLGTPMDIGDFLRLAINIARALGQAHRRGLIHKDLKPGHILVDCADGNVRLTGFGIATRLPRERQSGEPPDIIAGTLAYMAPEQTGRMNRSIDQRSDLYALGVTFYQMLTGSLPFVATEPIEWIHCHIARQPPPPDKWPADVPLQLCRVVLKLLAKTAEDRYQSAAGLERDLQRSLNNWRDAGGVDHFHLGAHDTPDRLIIPEKLYGREREVESLLAAFARAARGEGPELVLVCGYSGIGKTSLVNELHKALVSHRGLFASGRFDQGRREIPFGALVQAFRGLMRPLLGCIDAELAIWRDELLAALGPNARLMSDLIPELALIVGNTAAVPDLEPQQAKRRFQLVFRQLFGVFARADHPLALFLDDLQWLDPATRDVIEHLLAQPDLRHLLVVGAYRDNEVHAEHPLRLMLDAVQNAGRRIASIKLAPLAPDHVAELIADALRCDRQRAAPLARLVHAKTHGNPFFLTQFLISLTEEGLLRLDDATACWVWDLDRIHAKGYTDNVVDLMLGKLRRLSAATQAALQQLASIGHGAPAATLALVCRSSEHALQEAMWAAEEAGLVVRQERAYRFLHHRVQEAAYGLIPDSQRAALHLAIGRRLVAHTPADAVAETVFEIVGQLNRGAALIVATEERERVAELNLLAGRRAKASAAYASALTYFAAGAALLPGEAWARRRDLAFALELHRAECEFITGMAVAAEQRLTELADRIDDLADLASVSRQRVDLYMTTGQTERAVAVGLDYLHRLGVPWSEHPTMEDVRQEHARVWEQLGGRPIEAVLALPPMTDPIAHGTMDVLMSLVTPALWTDENLRGLVIGRMANLSLEYGNCDTSCYAYATVGTVLGQYFGDFAAAFRFGQVALDLVERPGMDRLKARVYLAFGNLAKPSRRHFQDRRPARVAFETAQQSGDLAYATISRNNMLTHALASGDPLGDVQADAEAGLDFAQKAGFGLVGDLITAQLALVRMLRGETQCIGHFDGDGSSEGAFETYLESDPRRAIAACLYWVRKLQARAIAGDFASAAAAARKAERLLWMLPVIYERADYHFHAALAQSALCDCASASQRLEHRDALAAHHRQLSVWATHCAENFEARADLVAAEIARLDRRELDAERLYECAIRSARANGLVQVEALCNERAARFHAARDLETIARAYMKDAHRCYASWGAVAKLRQLEGLFPYLRAEGRVPAQSGTIAAPVEHLDLATVIEVMQAVSGEMLHERLLQTIMRTAIAQAGAARGVLIIMRGAEPRIAAEAMTNGDAVDVRLHDLPASDIPLPQTVLQSVLRTRESLVLGDAVNEATFGTDPYVLKHQVRSVLCLPLISQAKLGGVLYLENNLAAHAFAPARSAMLRLLASQAAISLENTRLYRELAQREAKMRRFLDGNVIGMGIFTLGGRIVEANQAFLAMTGYTREDLLTGRIDVVEMTPPEWLEVTYRSLEEVQANGTCKPFEKEYVRRDGTRVPVLVGQALFEGSENEGVKFVIDLTERKRAEAELRESEHRYREVQSELAHANRVATLGLLTASIAHEVNQPIGAAVTNAQAALRWLAAQRPEEARQAIERIVGNGIRAGEVIGRIRSLIKKAPPRTDSLAINDVVLDIIALTQGEAAKNGIAVRSELADDLPCVEGDRVQLQQVILNLVVNANEAMGGLHEGPRELWLSTGMTEPDIVCVTVRDTGPGLPAGAIERVFDAFYTSKPGGLGLGLSICRSIVEAHGGRLWVTANLPRGACFRFTLAVRPAGVG